jgi:hypothetical protein
VQSLAEVENSEVKVVSQSWPKSPSQPARSALVVLCKRPSNHAIERSAQQRARCWVPSSLCSSAPAHCKRSASRSNAAAS